MYKVLLVDKRFLISLCGKVKLSDGTLVEDDGSNTLSILIDGRSVNKNRTWLGLLAHFEVDLDHCELGKISFLGCDSKLLNYRCGMMMVFNQPIYNGVGNRIVPGLPRYSIDINGNVRSIKTNHVMSERVGPYGYPVVSIYDPDKSRYRDIGVHILMGRAWITNSNPVENLVLNHKDGNKLNYNTLNLEWTSGRKNSIHARDTGLTTDNCKVTVYDIITSTSKDFPSISTALNWMGYINTSIDTTITIDGKHIPKLLKNRYYLLRYDLGLNVDDVPLRPMSNISGPYEALRISDGLVYNVESLVKLGTLIGSNARGACRGIHKGSDYPMNGYLLRTKSDSPWPIPRDKHTAPTPVNITAVNGNKSVKFKSIREATKYFKCDKTTITNRLNGNIKSSYNGWSFSKSH